MYTYSEIERADINGFRHYKTPDGPLPSVTTILECTKSRESADSLKNWRARVGDKEANYITNTSIRVGNRLHKNIENYLLHRTSPEGSAFEQILTKLMIDNGLKHIDAVWGVEAPLYYPELYAGTTDCVGIHNGTPAIIDFKNSRGDKKREWIESYFMQLVAYALAHNKLYGTNIKKGVIMMACHSGKYQEFIIEGEEFEKYTLLWLEKVKQYYSDIDK